MKKALRYSVILLCSVIAVAVLLQSQTVANATRQSFSNCLTTVIPSLYIFTVICLFIVKCDLFADFAPINFVFGKLYKVNKSSAGVIFLSLFCGYPIGAKLLNEQYLKGNIDRQRALKLLPVCTNVGPAFAITIIGKDIFGNRNIGFIIYISAISASLIIGFFAKTTPNIKIHNTSGGNYIKNFADAVKETNYSMFYICSWVIIANCFSAVLTFIPQWVCAMFEVTGSIINYSHRYGVFFTAFLVGFGGISVIMQIFTCAIEIKPNILYLILMQILKGVLTFAITLLIFKIFPQEVLTSTFTSVKLHSTESSYFISFSVMCFIITTLLFIQKRLKKC